MLDLKKLVVRDDGNESDYGQTERFNVARCCVVSDLKFKDIMQQSATKGNKPWDKPRPAICAGRQKCDNGVLQDGMWDEKEGFLQYLQDR